MTLDADETARADRPAPSRTGFGLALAAWAPLVLFFLVAATPQGRSDCTQSFFCSGREDNTIPLWIILVPATPVILGLATWAYRRSTYVLDTFPDSERAERASTALFLARLVTVATIVAWAWLWFWKSGQ